MKCLHCGHCCQSLSVVIIDDPSKGIIADNVIFHRGDGPCKHLTGDKPGEYKCAVHHYHWYRKTPCFSYGQVEQSVDTPCRMGEYILKGGNGIAA